MIWALLLVAAAPAAERGPWDNYSAPYKLVITWYKSGITVIDYPNRGRCEKGREAVLKRMREKSAESGRPSESEDIAFCIPG